MKISDILAKGGPSVSFEVFPPRKDAPFGPVKDAVASLAGMKPSFISVTYGASGNAQANTAEIASFVQDCGTTALAHLTCLTSSRDHIADEITDLRARGIENILCLRGDMPPRDPAAPPPPPPSFLHAVDLVKALRPSHFCLGGACYPECHPACEHIEEDIAHLKEKVDAGLDFLTTQMFFDNEVFFRFVDRCRNAGITVPIIPGLKPLTTARQVNLLPESFSIDLPVDLTEAVRKAGDDREAVRRIGVEWCTAQCRGLLYEGVPAVHFYTMGKSTSVVEVLRNCF